MDKNKRKISSLLLILIIGGLGGVLADQFFLPYLATIPPFSKIPFIQQVGNGTTIINPTERVIITENTALEEAVDKISPCLVAVQSYQNQRLISQGTGFIITSDGLVITAADLVPNRANQYLIFRDGQFLTAQVKERDQKNNLALLQIEQTNLPVVSLVDLEDLRLGERIIVIGVELVDSQSAQSHLNRFVNLGIIRSVNQETLKINLSEENALANGSPLINVKGKVIGLNLVDYRGLIKAIPADKIKEFINL